MSKAEKSPAIEAPTLEDLEQWRKLQKVRLDAAKVARAADAQQKLLEAGFFAYVKAKGGEKRRTTRFGFGLRIEDERLNVSWKNEWLKDHDAAAAVELAAAQPTKEVLYVDPPAEVEA